MTAETVSSATARHTGSKASLLAGEAWLGAVFVAPIVVLMGGLVFWPVLLTLWDSLHRVDPMRAGTPFIGLKLR